MLPRHQLDDIARQAISLMEVSLSENLPEFLKSDETLGEAREGFRKLAAQLFGNRIVTRGDDGAWSFNDLPLADMDDAGLDKIRETLEEALHRSATEHVVASIDKEAKTGVLQSLYETDKLLASCGIETPNSEALRKAIGVVEDEARTEISNLALHSIANRSLGLLDTAHSLNYEFGDTEDGRKAQALLDQLAARLDEADYLLPGQSSAREDLRRQGLIEEASYEGQTARGTYKQAVAIMEAAQALTSHLNDSRAFAEAPRDNLNATSFMQLRTGALASEISEARHETVRVDTEFYDRIPNLSPLEPQEADAIIKVYETAEAMAERATLDTQDGNTVTVPYDLFRQTKAALAEFSQSGSEAVFRDIVETDTPIPGIHNETARSFVGMIDNLRDMMDTAEARFDRKRRTADGSIVGDVNIEDKLVGVSQDDMDNYNSRSRNFLEVGALRSLYIMAGRDEASILSLNADRDSAAFGSVQEAMRGGRTARPDEALSKMGKILPEMSTAEYLQLPQAARERARAFELVPGKDEFKNFRSGGTSYETEAVRWNKSRLRRIIRDNLIGEDGKPNSAFRQKLVQLSGRPIVAPHRYEAEVLREESERIILQQQTLREEIRNKYLSGADVKHLDLSADQVRKHLNVLEASGSTRPTFLVKHGDNLVLEHPDAPTVTGRLDRMGSLEKAKDGYKLHSVDPSELRTALESGHGAIRISIADDRPMSIRGFSAAEKQAEQSPEAKKTRPSDRMSSLEQALGSR